MMVCLQDAEEKFLSLGKGMGDLNGISRVQLIITNTLAFILVENSLGKGMGDLKANAKCSLSPPSFD